MHTVRLTLVIPVFNEELVIDELDRRLRQFLQPIDADWDVVFVDDGSADRSAEKLQQLCTTEPRYRLITLSRNFGHQLAITAGMDYAEGDAVVIMDADLQDPPEVIQQMLERFRAGYDVVYGVRTKREKEGLFKRGTAAVFYRLLKAMVGVPIPVDTGDFRLISRRVVLTMRALRESNRFVRGMVAWIGFQQAAVHYERQGRFAGETHYPVSKMVRFAIDGILSFSTVPLRIATWLGVLAGMIGVLVAVWAVYTHEFNDKVVPGWATIMIAVSLAASAQLLMTGILGEYVGRIYDEVKRRPLYVVRDEFNIARPQPGFDPQLPEARSPDGDALQVQPGFSQGANPDVPSLRRG